MINNVQTNPDPARGVEFPVKFDFQLDFRTVRGSIRWPTNRLLCNCWSPNLKIRIRPSRKTECNSLRNWLSSPHSSKRHKCERIWTRSTKTPTSGRNSGRNQLAHLQHRRHTGDFCLHQFSLPLSALAADSTAIDVRSGNTWPT